MQMMTESGLTEIQQIGAVVGADPQKILAVAIQAEHTVMTDAVWLAGVVTIVFKAVSLRVKHRKSSIGTHPQAAVCSQLQAEDLIVRQTGGSLLL